MTPDGKKLEEAIELLLSQRAPGATICPGEAARHCFPETWREAMPLCREVAVRMALAGDISICRKGEPVDPEQCKGPIRLRKGSS